MTPIRRCDEPKQQALGPASVGPSHFTTFDKPSTLIQTESPPKGG